METFQKEVDTFKDIVNAESDVLHILKCRQTTQQQVLDHIVI